MRKTLRSRRIPELERLAQRNPQDFFRDFSAQAAEQVNRAGTSPRSAAFAKRSR